MTTAVWKKSCNSWDRQNNINIYKKLKLNLGCTPAQYTKTGMIPVVTGILGGGVVAKYVKHWMLSTCVKTPMHHSRSVVFFSDSLVQSMGMKQFFCYQVWKLVIYTKIMRSYEIVTFPSFEAYWKSIYVSFLDYL